MLNIHMKSYLSKSKIGDWHHVPWKMLSLKNSISGPVIKVLEIKDVNICHTVINGSNFDQITLDLPVFTFLSEIPGVIFLLSYFNYKKCI